MRASAAACHGSDDSARRVYPPHASGAIREVEIARRIRGHVAHEHPQRSAGSRLSIPIEIRASVARHRAQQAGRAAHPPDRIAIRFGDQQVALPVETHRHRQSQVCACRRGAIGRMAVHARARNRGQNRGGRVHPPDPIVGCIGDVQVAGKIESQPHGIVQGSVHRRAAVPGPARDAVSRHGGYDAGGRVHAPHPVAHELGDEEVARRVHRYAKRSVQRCLGRGSQIARRRCNSVPRYQGEDAGRRIHLHYAVVPAVRDVEVVGAVDADRASGYGCVDSRPSNPGSPCDAAAGHRDNQTILSKQGRSE